MRNVRLRGTSLHLTLSIRAPAIDSATAMGGLIMRIALLAGAALLSGCAIGYHKAMTADMKGLTGQLITTVIDRLGYPAREITIAGDKVYVWDGNGCTLKVGVDSGAHVIH